MKKVLFGLLIVLVTVLIEEIPNSSVVSNYAMCRIKDSSCPTQNTLQADKKDAINKKIEKEIQNIDIEKFLKFMVIMYHLKRK